MKKKVIGVLGGMGPESTVIFYHALIWQCQQQYAAQYDHDYPEMILYNLPIPDTVACLQEPDATLSQLIRGAQRLDAFGADFLVMPCNTVHYFYPAVAKSVTKPFICIFLVTAKKVKSEGYNKVGFLATETTIRHRSYDQDFDKNGVELILPDDSDQSRLTRIIRNILAGHRHVDDKKQMQCMVRRLQQRGAQAVVLACTDLPILLRQKDVDVKIFDTVTILAEATIQYAVGKIGIAQLFSTPLKLKCMC